MDIDIISRVLWQSNSLLLSGLFLFMSTEIVAEDNSLLDGEFDMKNKTYKVLTLEEWDKAQKSGSIITTLDQKDGFVHLSNASQLSATLSLYFSTQEKVILLQLEQSMIDKNLKYEAPMQPNKRLGKFPHFYDDLKTNMVLKIWHLERTAFNLPEEVLLQAENT